MRTTLLIWLLLLSGLVHAQTATRKARPAKTGSSARRVTPTRPAATARPAVVYKDSIYTVADARLLVKIDELTDSDVVYTVPASPGVKKRMTRGDIWKVVFSDGSQEVITPRAVVASPTPAPSPVAQSAPTASEQRTTDYATAPAKAKYVNRREFSRFHLTIGPELAYYASPLNKGKAWIDDSTGFGMKQNVGASLRIDYQFLPAVAISLTGGYYGWELARNYTRDGLSEYTETKRLTQIPVQLGVKLYPIRQLYVMPEGGVTLMKSSVRTSTGHPTPTDESVQTSPITYGGSLGYEFGGKDLLLDVSLRYQLLNVKKLSFAELQQRIDEQVGLLSLRVGIGFRTAKK